MDFEQVKDVSVPRLAVVQELELVLTKDNFTTKASVWGTTGSILWKFTTSKGCRSGYGGRENRTCELVCKPHATLTYVSLAFFERDEAYRMKSMTDYKCTKVTGARTMCWYPLVHEDRETTFGVRIRLMRESPPPTATSEQLNSDVTLSVCGTLFRANKAYLSVVSPVFDRMFNADFREKSSDAVAIKDTTPEDFGDFLACLYNVDLAIHEDNIVGLTLLADRYQVDNVLRRCLSYLRYCSKVPLVNKFKLAEKHNSDDLQRYLVDSLTVDDAKKLLSDPKAADINGLVKKFIELFTSS